jgi:hypothetical protein
VCVVDSVKTLLEVIDHLGERIKTYLPTLIPSMIENASEVEIGLRYVEQKYGVELPDGANDALVSEHFSSEIIKRVKMLLFFFSFSLLSSIPSSFIVDFFPAQQCTGYIDENVLEKLFPRLLELLKETISFSTRSAAINFVVMLSRTMDAQKLQPFVGKSDTLHTTGRRS